jgi:hypothetical protein
MGFDWFIHNSVYGMDILRVFLLSGSWLADMHAYDTTNHHIMMLSVFQPRERATDRDTHLRTPNQFMHSKPASSPVFPRGVYVICDM